MTNTARELSECIAKAVDVYMAEHEKMTIEDLLSALEHVRHVVTEELIKRS